MNQSRKSGAQLMELAGFDRSAKNNGARGIQGPESFRCFSVTQRADNDEVVLRVLVIFAEIAGKHGDCRRLAFRLPGRRQQPCEFGFIGENQYGEIWQEQTAP